MIMKLVRLWILDVLSYLIWTWTRKKSTGKANAEGKQVLREYGLRVLRLTINLLILCIPSMTSCSCSCCRGSRGGLKGKGTNQMPCALSSLNTRSQTVLPCKALKLRCVGILLFTYFSFFFFFSLFVIGNNVIIIWYYIILDGIK